MFSRKFRLFRLMGFEVGIDPSWIILAILVAWSLSTGYFPSKYGELSTGQYWAMGIIGAAGLFFSIIVHEFCHSVVARQSGMAMKGITLFIFGGVAEMTEEPPSARDEFIIAVVGPVSSMVMAVLFYGVSRLGTASGWPMSFNGVMGYLGMINLVLALFNLVPAYPLDGGRMLRAALWAWKGSLRRATRMASSVGEGFGVFLIVLGVIRLLYGFFIGGMWFCLVGLFIRSAAQMSYQQLLTRQALEGESLERFMNRSPVTVTPDMSLERLVEDYIYQYHHKLFPVLDGDRLVGCITTRHVKEVPRDRWSDTTVAQAAEACSPQNTIDPGADAVAALSIMHQNGVGRLMVAENGRLIGIISLKDLLDFLSMKVELEDA